MKKEHHITAIKLSLLVGTILNLINSYDVIINGGWTSKHILQVTLTYFVPYFVSIYSSRKADKDC